MQQFIRIGALISGSGTNLIAILDACAAQKIRGQVVFVGADTPGAAGLEHGRRQGIPTFVVDYGEFIRRFKADPASVVPPADFNLADIGAKQTLLPPDADPQKVRQFLITRAAAEAQLLAAMEPFPFDLLVLAGFMRNLTPYFIDRVNTTPGAPRIMNIHPALLPAFPGVDGYGDTFRYGCKVGGCTVHFVDYGEDSGPIIGQLAYEILESDTIDTVRAKGIQLEWQLYPECVRLFAEGRLQTVRRSYTLAGGRTFNRTVVKISPQASLPSSGRS